MTTRDDFDRLLETWLTEAAGAGSPDYLEGTLGAIGHLRQRSVWLNPGRWLPMELTMHRVAMPRAMPVLVALALLVLALVAALMLTAGQRRVPPPFGLARTGLLAFDTNGDIYVSNIDGTGTRPLVATPGFEHGPTFSRDGTRVAYWHKPVDGTAQLWVVDADGSNPRNLSGDLKLSYTALDPPGSWSPGSSSFAFASASGDLYVVAADGSGPARKLGDPALRRTNPAWSPDGEWIAFRGHRTAFNEAAIYVIRPDGTGETRVSGVSGGVNAMLLPAWSPDGRSLLYDAVYDGPPSLDGDQEIIVATRDGDAWTERVLIPKSMSWFGRFSNDGTRIAFHRCTIQRCVGARGDIYVVGVDGTGLRRVNDDPVGIAPPSWTPDDRAILTLVGDVNQAIEGQADARFVVLPLDQGVARAQIPAPGIQGTAAWSVQRLAP